MIVDHVVKPDLRQALRASLEEFQDSQPDLISVCALGHDPLCDFKSSFSSLYTQFFRHRQFFVRTVEGREIDHVDTYDPRNWKAT
jgi:hypothetical protein